jgi:hypothetical protein
MARTTVIATTFPLNRGERQLWAGVPRQGIWLRQRDFLLVPFSLMWGGFAINWEMTVLRDGAPADFALFGIPFVATGLYLIAGRFFFDAYRRSRIRYGITNERVLIESGVISSSLLSLDLASLHDLNVEERPDGTGTILFGSAADAGNNRFNSWSNAPQVPAFEGVCGAREVFQMIRDAKAAIDERRPSQVG